ncbi:MAG: hypothetical protein IKB19_01325 [Rikenellaceae bacterium]|nr:hypothetical protein [Rikenellaceae bacterium]
MKVEKIIYALLVVLMCGVAGCKRIGNSFDLDVEIARVGDVSLYKHDIRDIVPADISSEDSLKLVETYVDNWARKELKRQQANKVFASSSEEIERLVSEYRNSLLTRKLDQYYVDSYGADSLYGAKDLTAYYEAHKGEFKLPTDIVKGRVVAMPKSFTQRAKIKELVKASSADKLQDLAAMCEKNKLPYSHFEEWVDYADFLKQLPTKRNESYSDLLKEGVVGSMTDGKVLYYFVITEFKTKGSVSPYERVEEMIRWAVDKQRRADIVKMCDDSLYQAALTEQRVVINL